MSRWIKVYCFSNDPLLGYNCTFDAAELTWRLCALAGTQRFPFRNLFPALLFSHIRTEQQIHTRLKQTSFHHNRWSTKPWKRTKMVEQKHEYKLHLLPCAQSNVLGSSHPRFALSFFFFFLFAVCFWYKEAWMKFKGAGTDPMFCTLLLPLCIMVFPTAVGSVGRYVTSTVPPRAQTDDINMINVCTI